jgi:transposase-like protein
MTGDKVMATKKHIHQLTAAQFDKAFPDEEACCAYLVGKRWPKGVHCPRCGATEPTELKGNPWHWQCYQCAPNTSYRFSHLTGTIFENTNKPLKDWFRVIHLMLTSKKGMSALQIYRFMGFGSYKTAWYMCHRVRAALADRDFEKLGGVVEVDETFVGGKAKNRHDRWGGGGTGGVGSGKAVIAGAVRRKGNVVARVIENVRAVTLEGFVHEAVSHKVSLLVTDQWVGYRHLNKEYPQHVTVDHAKGDYVVGAIHTNTIEGFWSLIKRGMVGTFHKVSKKYLPLYVAEFQFRYNNRENADIFGTAISGC